MGDKPRRKSGLAPLHQRLHFILEEYGLEVFTAYPEVGDGIIKIVEGWRYILRDPDESEERREKAKENLKKIGDALATVPSFPRTLLSYQDIVVLPNEHRRIYKACEEICEKGSNRERQSLLQHNFPFLGQAEVEEIACYVKPGAMANRVLAGKKRVSLSTIEKALASSRKEEREIFDSISWVKYSCSSCEYTLEAGFQPKICPRCKASSMKRS